MSLQILDRVQEVTSTTGIGAIVLGGSPLGCIPFSGIGNGNSTYYTIDDNNGNWEVGLGIYSSGTNSLARNTVYASTNSGLLVSFSAGNKNIWLDAPAYLLNQISGASVTSGAITGALGYTPYNGSTNPSNFITSTGAVISGQWYTPTVMNASGTITINWTSGNVQYVILGAGNNTLVFSNPKDGARYMLELQQPTALGTVTWPVGTSGVRWAGGSAPTLSTVAGKIDLIGLLYNSGITGYLGGVSLSF